jgi:hypothetical protein
VVLLGVDFAGDLAVAVMESFERLLKLRVQIPVLTSFVETNILGGRQLTVGLMGSLVLAIPMTVFYKAVTGSTDGPASLLAPVGPQTFGLDDEATGSKMFARFIGMSLALFSAMFDGADACDSSTDPPNKGVSWFMWVANGTSTIIEGSNLYGDWPADPSATDKLDLAAWAMGCFSWLTDAIELMWKNEWSGPVADISGAISGALGTTSAVLKVMDAPPGKMRTLGEYDLVASVGELIASIGTAVPKDVAVKNPIVNGVRIGSIIGGHVIGLGAGFGGFTYICVYRGTYGN